MREWFPVMPFIEVMSEHFRHGDMISIVGCVFKMLVHIVIMAETNQTDILRTVISMPRA